MQVETWEERYTADGITAEVLLWPGQAGLATQVSQLLQVVTREFVARYKCAPRANHQRDLRAVHELYPIDLDLPLRVALDSVLVHSHWILPTFDAEAAGFVLHTEPFIPLLDEDMALLGEASQHPTQLREREGQ